METVQEVLERAYSAHFAGEFDAALNDYVWLFEDAAANDAQAAPLRLSYVLGGWAKLAEEHLPARHALVRTRDADTARLLELATANGDDASTALFNDIRAINDKLGDLQNTWRLFQQLDARHPGLARLCARSALPSLMACGDYALAAAYLSDPQAHLAGSAAVLNAGIAGLDLLSHAGMAELLAQVYNYVNELALVLDLYEGQGDTAALESAQQQAVALAGTPEARLCVQAELDNPGTTLDAIIEHQNAAQSEAAVASE